jgi:dinuclear metal center YbgI/SA1388 family protein
MKSEHLFRFLDEFLGIREFPDYPGAVNGLQVEGGDEVAKIAAAVDASEETIDIAARTGADLLLVHHGLFWGGCAPLTGPALRKVRAALGAEMAIYSAHLPLDAHPEVGNAAILAGELGMEVAGGFGEYEGRHVGCWGKLDVSLDELRTAMEVLVEGPVRLISPLRDPGPVPEAGSLRVGVVTGAGHGFIDEAAEKGLGVLVTGEAPHHAYHQAREAGIALVLAGHYATETWGVRALAAHVGEVYGIPWEFIDVPTGL